MISRSPVHSARCFALALPILALLAGASLAQEEARRPDGERITDPATIDRLLKDQTLYGRYTSGLPWAEYHAPDGRTAYRQDNCIYPGHWRVEADVVCFRYDAFNQGQPSCFRLYKHGDRLDFYQQDFGGTWHLNAFTVDRRQGNPEHMPVEGQACVGV
jgi:hypothetical protein